MLHLFLSYWIVLWQGNQTSYILLPAKRHHHGCLHSFEITRKVPINMYLIIWMWVYFQLLWINNLYTWLLETIMEFVYEILRQQNVLCSALNFGEFPVVRNLSSHCFTSLSELGVGSSLDCSHSHGCSRTFAFNLPYPHDMMDNISLNITSHLYISICKFYSTFKKWSFFPVDNLILFAYFESMSVVIFS